jgi:hypothetical protein
MGGKRDYFVDFSPRIHKRRIGRHDSPAHHGKNKKRMVCPGKRIPVSRKAASASPGRKGAKTPGIVLLYKDPVYRPKQGTIPHRSGKGPEQKTRKKKTRHPSKKNSSIPETGKKPLSPVFRTHKERPFPE